MRIVLEFFVAIFYLIGALVLVVSVNAIYKGPEYICASNLGWHRWANADIFRKRPISKLLFRAAPLSLIALFSWAGFSVIGDLLGFLGDLGVYDRENEEWVTYRSSLSATVGAPLGLFFGVWLVKQCEKLTKQSENFEKLSGDAQIRFIIFNEAPKDDQTVE